ncbi:MAG: acyl carrier protein [Curvibacter sp.]|nr:MAG: acyl carrier protein [Curvibacter sp.]
MKTKIRTLLLTLRPDLPEDEGLDLIEDGVLDSFDIIHLVQELDSQFGIAIKGTDITPENFRNVDTLAVLVGRYTGHAG